MCLSTQKLKRHDTRALSGAAEAANLLLVSRMDNGCSAKSEHIAGALTCPTGPSMTFEALRRDVFQRFSINMSDTDGFRGMGMLYDGKEPPRRADASRGQTA
jgi:hypothetical protein